MYTPEPHNSNPRAFMRNHQFSFRVSKQTTKPPHHHKSLEEDGNRRLGFIRNTSLRRILEGKHHDEINHDHPERGLQMHKHHKLTIKSYLGSPHRDEERTSFPEESESKEDDSESYFDTLYVHKPSNSVNKPKFDFKTYKEETIAQEDMRHHLSPFAKQQKVIHTIDEMPIPMRKSKRNLFEEEEDDEKPTLAMRKSTGDLFEDQEALKYSSTSAPDLRRPLPRRGQMKRRNSVTKFSQSMLNDQFESVSME